MTATADKDVVMTINVKPAAELSASNGQIEAMTSAADSADKWQVRQKFDGAALGTRIKLLREMRDMTLQAVADGAGLTKSHVWELEQGGSVNPTVNAVWGLSAALCVSPAMLLGLDDRMPPIDPVALKIAGIVDREMKKAIKHHMGHAS